MVWGPLHLKRNLIEILAGMPEKKKKNTIFTIHNARAVDFTKQIRHYHSNINGLASMLFAFVAKGIQDV